MKPLMDFLKKKDNKVIWYLGVLLAAGILLMTLNGLPFLSGSGNQSGRGGQNAAALTAEAAVTAEEETPGDNYARERALEKRLEEAFALVENVGRVRVMVSLTPDKETVYAVDANTSESVTKETDAQGGSRESTTKTKQDNTIIITDRTGTDRPLVLREIEPSIAGIVVIAEGGDNVFVKDALTKAACTVLGIEANKVQILKMK